MRNDIDDCLSRLRGTALMTHVVAGYPDLETSGQLVERMAGSGADLIEIQIPFSDPLADGPTIMAASHWAVEKGVTPKDVIALVASLRRRVSSPLLLMTYANIPFRMGWKRFIREAAAAGVSGLIVPDLPFDDRDAGYFGIARDSGIHPILLVSPQMDGTRLKSMLESATGFLYATLRVGITGARRKMDPAGLRFLRDLRTQTPLPVAAGFGISSIDHVAALRPAADIVIVGSHILNIFNGSGLDAVESFIRLLRLELDRGEGADEKKLRQTGAAGTGMEKIKKNVKRPENT